MPGTPQNDPPEGTYSLVDLQAMEAAGDVELAMPGTPEAAAARREMTGQLADYDADLVAREGPDTMTSRRQLRQAALDAESRPGTIGHALARSREARGWSRDELAAWLGTSLDGLAGLALEPRSRPGYPMTTGIPLERLADRHGADRGRLREALAP